jgi:heat shock protein HtpX
MLKTTMLMAIMTALMLFLGNFVGGTRGMSFMLVFSIMSNLLIYWYSDKFVISQYGAIPVTREQAPELYGIVEKLAQRAQLPMPKLYVISNASPNAFATGRDAAHSAVCVTTGLLDTLSPREVAGVLGHEMSHIKHGDILIGTVAACMAGVISLLSRFAFWFGDSRDRRNNNALASLLILILTPLLAFIIQMAVSRTREYMADETGGSLCGDPNALADALAKIEIAVEARLMPGATKNTAHMFIISPFAAKEAKSLLSTHPDTAERIRRLRQQAIEMQQKGQLHCIIG